LSKSKKALIIGTQVATAEHESGASLRLQSIKIALEKSNFDVTVSPLNMADSELTKHWDWIVVVSYSSARILRRARKQSRFLWFDPTDSWTVSRMSLFRAGDIKQIFVLMRDLYWVWNSPKIELLTFITKRDALAEKNWWKNRTEPLIFPISNLSRNVNPCHEIRYIFIGDGNYGPNKKALVFLSKALDYLNDEIFIDVYGKNFHIKDPRFRIHGYSNNSEIYSDKDVHLAPVTSGAGMKVKVAIPLFNGLHVITTPEGANGFKANRLLKVATTPKIFANEIANLNPENFFAGEGDRLLSPFQHDDSEIVLEMLRTGFIPKRF
jgi:hypothetical protein